MTMLLQATLGTVVGLLGGALFFRALRSNAELYLSPGPRWQPAMLHVMRLLLLGALLVATVRLGGGAALLGAFAGILLARAAAMRAWRSRP